MKNNNYNTKDKDKQNNKYNDNSYSESDTYNDKNDTNTNYKNESNNIPVKMIPRGITDKNDNINDDNKK